VVPYQCFVTLSDEALRLHKLAARESKMDLRRHLELLLEADAGAYGAELRLPEGTPLVIEAPLALPMVRQRRHP
jgi:hypothetical protein